jgi:site-specific DNA recombinase
MKPILKCAVYTRKSTDKGLEQDFNTLDAQRESSLAYITSQKSEGWIPVKQHYDDGGYSGGTLERPALQLLLDDIKAGRINIVVVYKIDRLTRSLADFAKLVEVFDQYGVSFVSVTQSFNTTTSMGRLTLNVLLSFAQFEREVIGERIRDKVAASKAKGMWMGGPPMLGYDIQHRQLIVNEKEAAIVRHIFSKYLDLRTVARLKDYLDATGVNSKSWIAQSGKEHIGRSYSRGALHHLLSNPVYAGCIRHKDVIHEGMHEAIISKEIWQQVQDHLTGNARVERGHKNYAVKNILKGKLFDMDGVLYTPMRAHKKGKQYRYYVSQNRVQNRNHPKGLIARLPAHEIETLILNAVTAEIKDINKLSALLALDIDRHYPTLEHISKGAETLRDLYRSIHRVIIHTDHLVIEISVSILAETISEARALHIPVEGEDRLYEIVTPYHTKRAQRGAVMIQSGENSDPLDLPKAELENLVKGIIWRDEHFQGKSFMTIAQENNCSRSFVNQLIQQSFEIA